MIGGCNLLVSGMPRLGFCAGMPCSCARAQARLIERGRLATLALGMNRNDSRELCGNAVKLLPAQIVQRCSLSEHAHRVRP